MNAARRLGRLLGRCLYVVNDFLCDVEPESWRSKPYVYFNGVDVGQPNWLFELHAWVSHVAWRLVEGVPWPSRGEA